MSCASSGNLARVSDARALLALVLHLQRIDDGGIYGDHAEQALRAIDKFLARLEN